MGAVQQYCGLAPGAVSGALDSRSVTEAPGRVPAAVPTRGPRRGRGLARVICVRVARLFGLLFGVSLLAFTLVYHSPVDPIAAYIGAEASPTDEQLAQLREYWGLDRSFAEQYPAWLGAVLGGDLGVKGSWVQIPPSRR
ncbi:hypothetical protein [Streptomyces alkaliphilus]|uniref:hypothetical protein n=1 Tax=Streptomyces alkaliphilus TaxID=1472722 RepID=UPI001E509A8C|nr:hypothetical protein [Streptomyces alkaliphilus]